MADRDVESWWREGALYQVYPRSYQDTNDDGIGDLPGIVERLDHLQWLGIRGVWLSPVTVSPNADFGYDVADFCDVDPTLGTLTDLEVLVEAASARGIRILLDLVPNHTSIDHPWFRESRSSRDNPKRDWYVWADPKPDGSPPNNWVSSFGGSAWTLDGPTGQYYLQNFLPEQADLNWWNEEVRDEFDRILRFWFDKGVAGFRIDVAHMVIKDRELRDNPPAGDGDPFLDQVRGQLPVYNTMRPEVHDVHRRLRAIADSYDPPRVLIGETFVPDIADVMSFYGDGDELNLAFNMPFLGLPLEAAPMREMIERTDALVPPGCSLVWTGSNHDVPRFPTRWAQGDPDRARCALMMLMTLPGCVFLFEGDEIGMTDTPLEREELKDPVSIRYFPVYGRDGARTPMQWRDIPGAGFTGPEVEPWLPFGDLSVNVEDQRRDPESFLSLCRDLIGLRDALPDLRAGAYASLDGPDGVLTYGRGERTVIALNLGAEAETVADVTGIVRVGTRRARDGERVDGKLTLEPGEGAIVLLDVLPG
ncbi:MAG TPA: alpha-amylase family glycosyl hydrolase [Acidimicrobiia bacterium]